MSAFSSTPGCGLEVRSLNAFYGLSQVVSSVSLSIAPGQVLTLVGRNGAGRSTLAGALVGRVSRSGSMAFDGIELVRAPAFRIARSGIGFVPEGREVFSLLTVEENLVVAARPAPQASIGKLAPWTLERCYELFPRLADRRHAPGGALSGGEQQMLVLCRALMGNPRLLIVDEPTEGLSPQMVDRVAQTLAQLKGEGLALLLIEQKLDIAFALADQVVVLGKGAVVFAGPPDAVRGRQDLIDTWIGVA